MNRSFIHFETSFGGGLTRLLNTMISLPDSDFFGKHLLILI